MAKNRSRPGLLVGTYYREREVSFFTFEREDAPLRRRFLYCPFRRDTDNSGADVDSLAVLPPERGRPPGKALPARVVQVGRDPVDAVTTTTINRPAPSRRDPQKRLVGR